MNELYWLNPNYRFRQESWGGYAWGGGYTDSFQIGKDAFQSIKYISKCYPEGISVVELAKELELPKKITQKWCNKSYQKGILIKENLGPPQKVIEKDFLVPYSLSAPRSIFLEITSKCNLKCNHCYTSSHPNANLEIETEEVKSLLSTAYNYGVYNLAFGGGEPLMRDDILKLARISKNIGYTLGISTNGLLLNDKISKKFSNVGVDYLLVSLDGPTPDIHAQLRGKGTFKSTCQGIRAATSNGLKVTINYVLHKNNWQFMNDMIKLANDLEASKVRFMRLIKAGRASDNYENLALNSNEYSQIINKMINLLKKDTPVEVGIDECFIGLHDYGIYERPARTSWLPEKYLGCVAGRSQLFIDAEGNCFPCGYLRENKFNGGNIRNSNLSEIWEGNAFDALRKITDLDEKCNKCNNLVRCSGGCRAAAYFDESLKAPDPLCWK
ncbi:MAG: radical SAM/SPASM domain-containing protein [Candidatus Woesearchaeota archaeon]